MPPELSAEAFADNVLTFLETQERSRYWLSRKTQIDYNTLCRQLDKPGLLTFRNAVALSEVTGIPNLERAA